MTESYRLIKRKYDNTGNERKEPKTHGRIKIFVILVKKENSINRKKFRIRGQIHQFFINAWQGK